MTGMAAKNARKAMVLPPIHSRRKPRFLILANIRHLPLANDVT